MIRIWTDGCCLKNPGGAGGWAFIAEDKGSGRVLHLESGGEKTSTNNRMELTAVIEALRWLADEWAHEAIEILCDSKYVVEGMNSWRHVWKPRGWRRKTKSPHKVANSKLWQQLDELDVGRAHSPRFVWVKGHSGVELNERADCIAGEAARAADTGEVVL